MADYRVLQWSGSFDGPWSEAAEKRYREGGFDGLILTPSSTWTPQDLEFLLRLPGLRLFSLQAKVKNDIAAFAVPSLEELALVTGSRLSISEVVQPRLRELVLTDRPGINVSMHWPALESFKLGTWRGTNLQLLDGATRLRRFHVEGRRQAGTLAGVESCESLEALQTVNYSIKDTAPLRGLRSLTELRMMAAHPTASHGIIDISDLSGSRLIKLWISNAASIRQLPVLADLPSLREVRLIDCRLTAADRQFLDILAARARVQVINARASDGSSRF